MKLRLIIFAVILTALGLRVFDIDQKNLWFDEVYSWKISQGTVEEIVAETSGDIHPPLYYIALKYWTSIFSESIVSMRMLSVLLSMISIFFLYMLARMFLKDDTKVILVLLLYAVSPLNIFYSQETRMLNLNLFLCLGSVYYFYIYIKTGKKAAGIIYIIFTTLALYTHYFAMLILFTESIGIIVYYAFQKLGKKAFINYLICLLVINILYIPWYPVFFEQTMKGQPWRTNQTLLQAGNNALEFFREMFFSSYYSFENSMVIYLSLAISILAIVFLAFSIVKLFRSKEFLNFTDSSIMFFFFIPLIISVFISMKQSILMSRYLSIIVPYFCITIVLLSFSLYKPKISMIIVILLVAVSSYGAYINHNNQFKNNDYRKIISYIEENFNPGDIIIAEPHYMGWVLSYHTRHSNTNIEAPQAFGWDLNMQLDSLFKLNYLNKVWIITDYSAIDNTQYDSLTSKMKTQGFEIQKEKSFYVIPAKVEVGYYVKLGR